MNKEFANEKEKKDYQLLEDFNKVLKLIEIGRCPEKHTTDASGYTTDGRLINIELKMRNMILTNNMTLSAKTYTADTLYIEAHKTGDMLLDYVIDKQIPLYINFLQDGTVILYNLSTLKHRPNKVSKRIYSELYQAFELAKREELRLEDAWIYKKENNEYKLIYKP